jgi:hypothetical protein
MAVETWAKDRLASLLAMPKDDAGQMVTYLMTLSQEEAPAYLSVRLYCMCLQSNDWDHPYNQIMAYPHQRLPLFAWPSPSPLITHFMHSSLLY